MKSKVRERKIRGIIIGERRKGKPTEYIDRIGYDEYGQRVYIRYGNGVETTYTYDENRRWLDNISTENQYGNSYQEINYQFDTVGNILRMENNLTPEKKEIVERGNENTGGQYFG